MPASANNEDKVTLVTKDGFKKLKEELDYLRNIKRKEIADRIKEAISYGDLSENSEYEEAKNEQAFVEGRIIELEDKVKYAKIIDDKKKSDGKSVQLGSTVKVKNRSSKSSKTLDYIIVGSTEADWDNKISNESPVGKALLDRKVGDRIKIHVPAGIVEYEILDIE
ncbi:transcription elongation factor GreA [Candidatus Peregrinibacteria bacterium]|nr:transcription elongation factor GreA [Candidatus Peregrinibacteria bacterium]